MKQSRVVMIGTRNRRCRVASLSPTATEESLMDVKSVEAQSPHIGVVWRFEEWKKQAQVQFFGPFFMYSPRGIWQRGNLGAIFGTPGYAQWYQLGIRNGGWWIRAASSSSFIPTPLAHADNQGEGHPRGGAPLHWRPTKFNLYDPEVRGANGFSVLPEVCFSGSENVNEFLEGINNQIRLLEIPSDLSCAYLKGHLLGIAQYWYQIFGSALVQNTATDFAQLKEVLSKAFPAIRNKKELEIKFYASQHRRDQEPTDFVYDLLKLHKQLKLGMSEEALVNHIFFRFEPQVVDYVEV
ncbi:uncharacterized protein TNCV_3792271 [Trichonephila clavipes]|nr:uncharacterized protein TNCV_3792271 [Trichonephila clavipes]